MGTVRIMFKLNLHFHQHDQGDSFGYHNRFNCQPNGQIRAESIKKLIVRQLVKTGN